MTKQVYRETSDAFIKEYFLYIVIYTFIISGLFLAGYYVCNQRVWYKEDYLYSFIHWIHKNWLPLLLGGLLGGYVVISCAYLCIIASMLGKVADAVDMLYTERVDYIKLPGQLHEMEVQMNQVMHNARQSRQATREAEQQKNDLIVYMAHDLKTPLTSVIGYLTLLRDEAQITEDLRKKYLDIALRKSERLEELLNEFFEITRFNLSQMTLEMSEVNISRMTEQILYEFKPLFEEKGLTYRLEMEQDISLSCDVDKMERVYDNLLKNAVNYSYENTEILVKLQRNGDMGMRLTVINHGKTIPKEKLSRIFEQFFRLDSSRASKTGGSGLGLAIAKEIIALHGGCITCESEKEQIIFTVIM